MTLQDRWLLGAAAARRQLIQSKILLRSLLLAVLALTEHSMWYQRFESHRAPAERAQPHHVFRIVEAELKLFCLWIVVIDFCCSQHPLPNPSSIKPRQESAAVAPAELHGCGSG